MIKVKVLPMMQTGEDDAAMAARLEQLLQSIESVSGQTVMETSCDNGRMIVIYRSI
jgi:hypothetical protein